MRLFFDLRLGYLVDAPGQSTPVGGLQGKAGDSQSVEIQFGRSSDPVGGGAFFEGPTWTPEDLPAASVVSCGLKLLGEYSDGDLLAGTSSFSYDAERESYFGLLDLNTEELDALLNRGDEDDENDVADEDLSFEVTYQPGGSGPWQSSILPVSYKIYHDVLYGDEASPTSAADPDEYLLKLSGIEWLPDVIGLTGGGATKLDGVPTLILDPGKSVALLDEGATPDKVRFYRLEAGTDAEDAPSIIRPDDYATTTNEKIWRLYALQGDEINPAIGVAESIDGEIALFDGAGGKQLKRATGTGMAKVTAGVLGTGAAGTDFVAPGALTGAALTMATDRLIGRTTASTGAPEEITVGAGLSLSAGALTAVSDGLPVGTVALTDDTTLTNATHNGRYIIAASATSIITIGPQSSSSWADNAQIWVANQLVSSSVTVRGGSGVTLLGVGSGSADYVIAQGGNPIRVWRSAENVWRIISA